MLNAECLTRTMRNAGDNAKGNGPKPRAQSPNPKAQTHDVVEVND
jgi:hypothetical protein